MAPYPSQWSTLQSGPLVHSFSPLLRLFPQFLPSQWSTLQSGPLAHSLPPFLRLFRSFCLSQWSTLQSGPLAHSLPPFLRLFPQLPPQPVVHSSKWATSSQLASLFAPFSAVSAPASGPLSKVDH